MKKLWLILLGLSVCGVVGGILLTVKLLVGDWSTLGKWVGLGALGCVALAIACLIAYAIGFTVWHGCLPDERPNGWRGVEGRVKQVKQRRAQAAYKKAAAAKQDGQLSEAVDARGRVALTKEKP